MAPGKAWNVNLYQEGSCVYRVDDNGDIIELVAWARSGIAARAAFDYLVKRDPKDRFEQRKWARVEAEYVPPEPRG